MSGVSPPAVALVLDAFKLFKDTLASLSPMVTGAHLSLEGAFGEQVSGVRMASWKAGRGRGVFVVM